MRKAGTVTLPAFMKPSDPTDGPILTARGLAKSFGGIKAVEGVDITMADRRLHALIGPNGAGKTTAFNLISGLFPPDRGEVRLRERSIGGMSPEAITQAGIGRAFQITNLFPTLSVEENVRLAVQARASARFGFWRPAGALDEVNAQTATVIDTMGLRGIETAEAGSLSYGGQRLLDMSLALATKPRVLLLDEPLAGLAAAERERVGNLIKSISTDLPVLLVEHDIDRVFAIADHVTVMNEGSVLVDGTVEDARSSPRVQEIYIGSGAHALAEKPRQSAARSPVLLGLDKVDTFYGKSHILQGVDFSVGEGEIVSLLGRNGVGRSTTIKAIMGEVVRTGSVKFKGQETINLKPHQVARCGLGYVPENRDIFPQLTVRENLTLGMKSTKAGGRWSMQDMFDLFPRLQERIDTPGGVLSGGEKARLVMALMLYDPPNFLVLDEPTHHLDIATKEMLINALAQYEGTMLFVSHDRHFLAALSNRTLELTPDGVHAYGGGYTEYVARTGQEAPGLRS